MSWDDVNWAPQGWECPKCHRVYSPSTAMCFYCGNYETTTSTTFTLNSYKEVLDDIRNGQTDTPLKSTDKDS